MDITYQVMVPLILWIHKFTNSYGMSIVVLTLMVRAAVWPLVGASTKNMKQMQLLQPKMKAMQARYKDDPELLSKKMQKFYELNKFNPVLGCLPMLIQLPLLFALFGTFNGPPFGDHPVDVKVTVVAAADASKVHRNETSGSNSPYVSPSGLLGKVIVFPGESIVTEGQSLDFATRAVDGEVPSDFKVRWEVRKGNELAHAEDAVIDQNGHATFLKKGEYRVDGVVDGIAKHDSFGPIRSLGNKPTGMQLLKPENIDHLALILFFRISMYFSSKISMAGSTKPEDMDENQRTQADAMKFMPLIMTGSFCMYPLPTGVLLYMVVSNAVQTFQTWLFMKAPVKPLIDPDDLDGGDSPNGGGSGSPKTIDIGPSANKNGASAEGATIKFNQADPVGEGEKRKSKKKKKK